MKISSSKKHIFLLIATSILSIIALGAMYYAGLVQGLSETKTIVVQEVKNTQKNDGTTIDFNKFWAVWDILKTKYVTKEAVADNKKLLYGAMSGLVNALDDPYTTFFEPKNAKEFTDEIEGHFVGIGAEIGLDKNGRLVVISPLKGTPAERAGLQAGDYIARIDDKDTTGLLPEEAVKFIRGEQGTTVVLTIISGKGEPKKVSITRDTIQIPTLDFKMLNEKGEDDAHGSIAYIKLYNFYEQAPTLFRQAAIKTILMRSKGIVVDLRNNPGGYLEAAQMIAGWFLPEKELVVTEAFQDTTQNQNLISPGPHAFQDIPVVVLINKGSASASEIVAGALQDHKAATIMGEKSFGKGTVQQLIPVGEGAMIKITIAHWLTPNGNLIDKNGITPDVILGTSTNQETQKTDPWIIEAVKKIVE